MADDCLSGCRVTAHFHPPPPLLAGCLTSIYRLDLEVPDGGTVVDWLQPEWSNLRIFSGGLPRTQVGDGLPLTEARFTVSGPSTRAARFELGTTRMWGVGLLPLGWARIVGRPAGRYANMIADAETHPDFVQFAPLGTVFGPGPDADGELDRIVAALVALARPVDDEERIVAVHTAMTETGMATVADCAARAGVPVRTLERICFRYFGFPPKTLLRRQRFMRSLAAWMLGGMGKWTPAIDQLYTDQAHFNREFREFMGMNPTQYAALPHPILSAFMAQRAKTWGSPAQTLDRPAA